MAGQLALTGAAPVRTDPWPRWPQWGHLEEEAVLRVLRSGSWGGYSEEVDDFEEAFALQQQALHCTATSNGTVSLVAALLALGIGPGDEVIVPPYTFIATASTVRLVGAVPVFADIELGTYNLDVGAVEDAVSDRTKAIMPVHFAGQSADLDGLTELASRLGLAIIEDAAHAPGSTWRGRPVGAIGTIGSFSFQSNKNLTAGEGGCIVTNDDDLASRVWSQVHHGRDRGGDWYEHPRLGSNLRISGWQAAVLNAQLASLPDQISRRTRSAQWLRETLPGFGLRPLDRDSRSEVHAYHLFVLRYDPADFGGTSREVFVRALRAEGVPCSTGYPHPLYRRPALVPPLSRVTPCPIAERACHEALWLSHPLLLAPEADLSDIATAVERISTNVGELASHHNHE